MKRPVREVIIGLLVGLAANATGTYLYLFFFSEYPLEESIKLALQEDILGSLIALGALLNLGAFFIFLKKKQYYRARGVVLATVLAALAVLVSKFY
ncbi:MAG: hypothetical protein CMC08_05805 [Flavobacteriaceae bacterium]|nr:hypothetical protein [Flavobacteriaceae bacterium]